MNDHTTETGLTPFVFEGATIRVVQIGGEPHFVGKDVADRLGYADPTTAIRSHCRGVQKLHPIPDALGRTQEVRVLSEPDVLRLIVKSNLPAAERFERWVFEEVLPAIRRTGSYRPTITADDLLANPKQLLAITQGYALQIEDMKRDMAVMQKDVEALDRLAGMEGSFGLRQSAKALSTPERKFTEYVQRIKWCFRQRGSGHLMGFAEKERAGYLTHKLDPYTKPDGTEAVRETLRFKPAGLVKLARMLNVTLDLSGSADQENAA